jgi:hypothetical protein
MERVHVDVNDLAHRHAATISAREQKRNSGSVSLRLGLVARIGGNSGSPRTNRRRPNVFAAQSDLFDRRDLAGLTQAGAIVTPSEERVLIASIDDVELSSFRVRGCCASTPPPYVRKTTIHRPSFQIVNGGWISVGCQREGACRRDDLRRTTVRSGRPQGLRPRARPGRLARRRWPIGCVSRPEATDGDIEQACRTAGV